MKTTSRRDIIFGAGFSALTSGCLLLRPRRAFPKLPEAVLAHVLPAQVGPYREDLTGDFVVPPTDSLSSKLYDKVVTRLFSAPGFLPIMALAAYGSAQNLTLELHRPEECYPMTGFAITPLAPVALHLLGHAIPAAFLTARRPGRTEQILFWSRIGQRFPPDRKTQTLMVAQENLDGIMPDGLLLRLSIIDDHAHTALDQMLAFMNMLSEALSPIGRRVIMGDSAAM